MDELRWLAGSRWSRVALGTAAVLVLLFLIFPILIVVPMSFSGSSLLTFPPPSWSLRWYRAFLGSPEWMAAFRISLTTAAATCAVATPLGVAAAYGLHVASGRWADRLRVLLLAPLMIPGIIAAVGTFFLYARLGLNGTLVGLVLAHVVLALPFVVVTTLAGLRGYDFDQEKAARSLGLSRRRAFLKVTLPQIRGSVVAGALFGFITSFDEVIIALFVTSGPDSTLTKRMFAQLRDQIDPTIAAISTVLVTGTFVIAGLALLATRRPGR